MIKKLKQINEMNVNLRKIANTAAKFSKKSKVHAIAASPMAAIAVIGIKTDETIKDLSNLYKGHNYKTPTSKRPTK